VVRNCSARTIKFALLSADCTYNIQELELASILNLLYFIFGFIPVP
jgi:hypothetical protein